MKRERTVKGRPATSTTIDLERILIWSDRRWGRRRAIVIFRGADVEVEIVAREARIIRRVR